MSQDKSGQTFDSFASSDARDLGNAKAVVSSPFAKAL